MRNLIEKRIEAELEMSDRAMLNPGALEFLDSLKGKVKLALASINNKLVIDLMLMACELRDFFDVVLSADEALKPKPNPEIFLKCAFKLQFSQNSV